MPETLTAVIGFLAFVAFLPREASPATVDDMPPVAAKKPARKDRAYKSRSSRRLPAFMEMDAKTGLAVAKARPGVRVLSTAEVRAMADA